MLAKPRSAPGAWVKFFQEALVYKGDDCLDWPLGKTGPGYGCVWIEGRHWGVHHLVCQSVHGRPTPSKPHAAHRCGRPACVNPAHLYWASTRENMRDRVLHGTLARGRKLGLARQKLTESQVRWLRTQDQNNRNAVKLAKELGITRQAIRFIWQRKTWAWLDQCST